MSDRPTTSGNLSRRAYLLTATASGVALLAGCLGGGGETTVPDPVDIEDDQACDQCDMRITMHPGPVGQAYYLDDTPEDLPDDREDGHARFCSSSCTYVYTLERDPSPAGIYTTDYATVDYTVQTDAGTPVIDAHFEADAFADVEELTYVVDSDVEGAMGGSLIGFSESADAEAFRDEYGGELVEHGDVTLELVRGL